MFSVIGMNNFSRRGFLHARWIPPDPKGILPLGMVAKLAHSGACQFGGYEFRDHCLR